MQRPASRLLSPIANISPRSRNKTFQSPPVLRTSAFFSCSVKENNSAGSTPAVNYNSPKATPRLRLADLDGNLPQALCLSKFTFHSGDSINVETRERTKVSETNEESTHSFVDFNSPNRERVLNSGLDGLKVKSSQVLGKGGFGVVVLAIRKGRKVAVKVITKRSSRRNSCEACVVSEENGLGLQHPNLVQILEVFGFRRLHAVVMMEYAGNQNLNQIVSSSQYIDDQRRIRFAFQIACGLSWCHRHSIAHLDIKPSNVVVDNNDWCKLGDFGCSIHLKNKTENQYIPGGTITYRAPELLSLSSNPCEKADIYSLAITMWQLLSRKVPFEGLDSHTIIYKVVAQESRPAKNLTQSENQAKYVQLYSQMWTQSPELRPSIDIVVKSTKQLFLNRV